MPTPLDCGSQEQRNYCCFQPPGTAAPGHSHGLQIWNLILQIPQMLAVILSPLFLPHPSASSSSLLGLQQVLTCPLGPGAAPSLFPCLHPGAAGCSHGVGTRDWGPVLPWPSECSPPPQRWQLSPAQTSSGPSKTSLLPDLRGHTVPPVLWGLPRELPRSGHPLCPFCPARADGGPWDGDSGPSLCG